MSKTSIWAGFGSPTERDKLIAEICHTLKERDYSNAWCWHGGYSDYKGEPIAIRHNPKMSVRHANGLFQIPVILDDNIDADVRLDVRLSVSNSKAIAKFDKCRNAGRFPIALIVAHAKLTQVCYTRLTQPNKHRCGPISLSVAYYDHSRSFGITVGFDLLMRLSDNKLVTWGR